MAYAHYIISITTSSALFEFWNKVDLFALALIPPIELSYAFAFVGKEELLKRFSTIILIYTPVFVIIYFLWNTDLLEVNHFSQAILTPWGYTVKAGPYLNYFTLYHLLYYITSYRLLFMFYKNSKERVKKRQSLLFIVALLIPTIGGVLLQGIIPGLFNLPAFPGSAPLVTVTNLIMTYAILKYTTAIFNPSLLATLVFQKIQDAVIGINTSFEIEYLNTGAEKLLLASKNEMETQLLNKIFDDDTYNKVQARIKSLENNQLSINLEEAYVLTAASEKKPVRITITKMIINGSVLIGYVLVITDITEVKIYADRLEKLNHDLESIVNQRTKYLEAEHKKLLFILSGVTDAVIAVDLHRRVIIFNVFAEKMFGVSAEAVIGRPLEKVLRVFSNNVELNIDFYCPRTMDNQEGILFREINVKVTCFNETTKTTKEEYANLISGKIKDGEKVNLGCILTLHNVTEEQRLEKMKLDFVSMTAHELRTPLAAANGYLFEFMKENEASFNENQKNRLNKINVSLQRLHFLSENILNAFNLESENLHLHITQFDWIAFVNKTVVEFNSMISEKGLECSIKYPEESLTPVSGDEEKFHVVLYNLIENAIIYTEKGGKISISVQKTDNEIITRVADTGIGIPAEAIPYLFTKFFRVKGGLEMGIEKTGLGLYSAKVIVEAHKGKIVVESKVNKGSTFSFTVPNNLRND